MFAGKTAINKMHKIHYRILQVVYNNFTDPYDTLISVNNNISIHQNHLWYLAVEVHNTAVEIFPRFMWTYFLKNPISHDLRKVDKVFLPPARSASLELIHFCSEAVFFEITFPLRSKY